MATRRKKAADQPADVAVDGQHPESVIKDVPDDEKDGPSSVMQQEIRPDERDEAVGKSALATPPAE